MRVGSRVFESNEASCLLLACVADPVMRSETRFQVKMADKSLRAELAQLIKWLTLNQEVPGSNLATAF